MQAPASVINHANIIETFGQASFEQLVQATYQGDPLADAVIAEFGQAGSAARQALQTGLTDGLDHVKGDFPAVRAFLAAAETLPTWVDVAQLERGAQAYCSIGVLWLTLALGPGSLVHTYSAPTIADLLVQTGDLEHMATKRIIDTGTWGMAIAIPQALQRGRLGYVHSLQVRLLHAQIRNSLLKRNWDTSKTGLPINQLEMVRTWLDFTYVPFTALARFGIDFTSAELGDLYHLWRYIGYLLGIDPTIYQSVIDQASAARLLDWVDSSMQPPNASSRRLTAAMIQAVSELVQPLINRSFKFSFALVTALTHHFHGRQLSRQLGIKRSWISAFVPLVVIANRWQRRKLRRNQNAWQAQIQTTANDFYERVVNADQTAYQAKKAIEQR
ncbi:oxygenase MpaB family protein [Herpetosiphon sp. NSE202]|uniref:oxygenase MpaB family protein n=1 Tax=Herpetosiphon sp. NSE202 TaxID=3351349 RepID=UPI0036448225